MAACAIYGDDQAFAVCAEAADSAVEQECGVAFQRVHGSDPGLGGFYVCFGFVGLTSVRFLDASEKKKERQGWGNGMYLICF